MTSLFVTYRGGGDDWSTGVASVRHSYPPLRAGVRVPPAVRRRACIRPQERGSFLHGIPGAYTACGRFVPSVWMLV